MLKKIPLALKIPALIAVSAILLAVGIAAFGINAATRNAQDAADDKLRALLDNRSQVLTHYLLSIEQDARTVASSPLTRAALGEFSAAWAELGGDQQQVLQDAYITGNPNVLGEKENLDAAGTGSIYDAVHGKYHPWFRTLLKERGYYDIFLFDLNGNLVYTVFKELDFATNLNSGEFRDTDLGNAFRAARTARSEGSLHFFDFKPYSPSHGAPASFISIPLMEGGETIGVLAFQMPAARINAVMAGRSGLGTTGETLIVGEDGLMRNDSRFADQTTILNVAVQNIAIDAALNGVAASTVSTDYRDMTMKVQAVPFEFHGTRWALVAVIGLDEIMAPIHAMRDKITYTSLVILVAITLICLVMARGIVAEVQGLIEARNSEARAHRAKSEFLAMMSHEIRTPMNGILGMASVLADSDLSESQRAKLDVIRFSGDSMLNVLNDILDISRIEAGRLELENIPFSLHDVLRKVKEVHALKAEERGVSMTLSGHEAVQALRLGDANRIVQILHNLASNAVKFTDTGVIAISCEVLNDAKEAVRIEVADTGIGMSAEQVARVFAPFVQASRSTTRKYGGSGLGLSIVKNLVDAMGGKLNVESMPGMGTTFAITLPLELAPGVTDETRPEMARSAAGGVPRALSVLVAEDNEINRLVLKAMLEPFNFSLDFAANGLEAVDAFAGRAFDIVLMDIEMPEMGGREALSLIREHEASNALAATPVIAVSAHATPEHIKSFVKDGFTACVTKPLDPVALVATIRAACPPSNELHSSATG